MNLRRLAHKPAPIKLERPPNIEWKMKTGDFCYSHEMGNSHIYNCIQLLEKNLETISGDRMTGARNREKGIQEFKRLIDQFQKEVAWRNQNSTYINKTFVRKQGMIF